VQIIFTQNSEQSHLDTYVIN